MVTFRSYQPSDYDQVCQLLKEADLFAPTWESKENLDGIMQSNPNGIIVGVHNEEVIANIFSIPYGNKIMFFFRLAVKKDYRNQGIATKLLDYAQQRAIESGCVETCLFADAAQEQLQQFYTKRGFVTSSHTYTCFWKEYPKEEV